MKKKNNTYLKYFIYLLFFVSFLPFSVFSFIEPKVIYDNDNRREFFQIGDEDKFINALGSVALVSTTVLNLNGNFFSFPQNRHGERNNLCSSERFLNQTNLSFCSGALVTKEHILTAGHCVSTLDCRNISFVFRYRLAGSNSQTTRFPLNHVYSCKKVEYIKRRDFDIALLKLDRPIEKGVAFPLGTESPKSPLLEGEQVYMIGHPDGLPQKIVDEALVRSTNPFQALTNLDAYRGNSGSPVFNEVTDLIEGVLVSGETDYVRVPGESCNVSKVCKDEECTGEAVSFIPKELSELILNLQNL